MPAQFNRFFTILFFFTLLLATGTASGESPYRILLTNDDGYEAEGINAVYNELSKIAEVTVCAPLENHSGAGHALTVDGPIKVKEIKKNDTFWGYAVNCTPATSVKIGLQLMKAKPHLVVSGINEGGNLGKVIFVSGTFGAAQEGVLNGIPAIAASLERAKSFDYQAGAEFVRILATEVLHHGMPQDTIFNVNIPGIPWEEIAGVAQTTLSSFQFQEIWFKRKTPWGQDYFWAKIQKPSRSPENGSDWWAIENNMISVTPVSLDFAPPEPKAYFRHLKLDWAGKPYRNFYKN
jgi:5'-nucleotidase